ncbi:histone H1.1, embryonic-like [Bicyclus anynana]|uniref:Histone H1.1, embryonic-like n=1 Tax=Bicyclus anynana TaxID=110368 RepID=A0A6J1P4S8_BICAN|nr:histone H1.1, embryonic-like [Bicyclus anynana]
MSDESDIEIHSALPKTKKKISPMSPTQGLLKEKKAAPKTKKLPTSTAVAGDVVKEVKKMSTKEMVNQALSKSRSRKGISLYVIKKHIQENNSVDIDKINYYIKKHIKESVKDGTIIQTKGVGASGSFRLAPVSKQPKEPSKKPKKTTENEKTEKPKKVKTSKEVLLNEEPKPKKKVSKKVAVEKDIKPSKSVKIKENMMKNSPKPGPSSMKTPKKKVNRMMKRKSIGSIIKTPKMKPRAVK